MVYEDPANRKFGSKWWLGPLRIFTSQERTAQLLRAPVKILIKEAFTGIGFGKLIEFLLPEIKQYLPSVYKALLPWKNDRWGFIWPVVGFKSIAYGYVFWKYINNKWRDHMMPVSPKSLRFFWEKDTAKGIEPIPEAGGVVFDEQKKRWYAQPVLTLEGGIQRAFNYTGMAWGAFIKTEFTVGLQYPATSMWRMFLHYWNIFPQYNNRATRVDLYQGVINTSFACFIVGDKKFNADGTKSYGNVVMTNVWLPYATDGMRFFSRLEFVLNHGDLNSDAPTAGKFVKAICTWVDISGEHITEVWGSENPEENTHKGYTPEQQLDQAALIMIITVSLYSHAIIHWWANGAALVDEEVWPAQLASADITNWMNTQAIYLSWLFMGNQMASIQGVLVRNNAQGLPLHFPTTQEEAADKNHVWRVTGRRSRFHKMGAAGREFLINHLKKNHPGIWAEMMESNKDAHAAKWNIGPNVDCILAATIWHNAEHYYANKYFPLFGEGNCVILQTDCSGLIQSLIAPIKYCPNDLRVKRRSDPVSQGLYAACKPIDAHFADNALCIGCAF